MQEIRTDSELHLEVTGIRRDGRRRYDEDSKRALARACLQPGVSLAGMALKHGVNAKLLRKWVVSYQLASDAAMPALPPTRPMDAFVPVLLGDGSAERIAQGKRMPVRPAVAASPSTATVSMTPARLRVQMPNGVTFEFECTDRDTAMISTVIETLGRCNVSSGR
jgi:transposase